MTWLDVVLIVWLVVFLAVGARIGSLWIAACVAGGFFGSFLVDYYGLPVAEMIGGFPGAKISAGILLYAGGVLVFAIPGYLLSKISSGLILGTIDSVVGLLAGGAVGLIAALLIMMLILPEFPSIESKRPWSRSIFVRPLHRFGENVLDNPRLQSKSTISVVTSEAQKAMAPAAQKTQQEVKNLATTLEHKLKK